ncbi:kazal-type serine protease inhibitor domain-containing protein [Phthorimaea operculella]|nr:kazal-type serine protease inhibitor domain-containing protein [Phthorimaea operculella]
MVNLRAAQLCALVAVASACYLFPSDVPNPCQGVTCGPGALCRPTPDGRSHTCECPESCPSYGDHEGSRPLCANDARDYPGDCEMRRAACETNTNITFKYYGKCDPCAGVTCPDPEVCQLDDRRQPSCRCAEPCPLEFSPVCASDGKTYSNECQMHRESCRARKQLKIVFKGQCSTGVNPCAEVECRHGAECRVEGGGAVCACPPPCEPILRPVCGSDSRTHDSECELRRAACLLGRELKVLHAGACGSNGVCAGRVCPHGGECVASGERGVCRCPRCSNEFAPVCGSDGISYGNRCKLQLEACRHRRDVQVLYDGPCNGCENKKCEFYAVCESDGVSEASCVCPKHCEEGTETEEVCGNDNQTYSSVCALRDVACREKRRLHVKHMGSCESCAGIECPAGTWCARGKCACSNPCADAAREPVCANTHHTFVHECALQKAACEARMRGEPPLRVAYYGECAESQEENGEGSNKTAKLSDLTNEIRTAEEIAESSSVAGAGTAVCARVQCAYEATCAVDQHGQPRCACLFDCAAAAAASSAPVCASDFRLYPTLCHMKLEACRRQEDLRLRPLALCRGLEVIMSSAPVCASDFRLYPTLCHMKLEACRRQKDLRLRPLGLCRGLEVAPARSVSGLGIKSYTYTTVSKDIFTSITRPHSLKGYLYNDALCTVDQHGQPRCACLFDCAAAAAASSAPVCASDFRLYPTLCHMKLEACRRQEDLRLRPLALCRGLEVAMSSAPVCASDFRLYPTLCHMKLEACRRQEDLRLRPLALCRGLEVAPARSVSGLGIKSYTYTTVSKDIFTSITRPHSLKGYLYNDALCTVDQHGQPRCACLFDCAAAAAASSAPVCASEFRLYPTLCHMKLEACRRQEDLRLRPLALCKGLEVTSKKKMSFAPVCASDFRLYPTLCHMKLEACRRQEDLRLRPLALCRGLEVTMSSAAVCASDFRLYPTLCHMKLEACRRQEDLRLRPLALCRGLEVTMSFVSVCASDFRLYPTLCHMKLEACRRQEDLRLRPLALCRGLEVSHSHRPLSLRMFIMRLHSLWINSDNQDARVCLTAQLQRLRRLRQFARQTSDCIRRCVT